MRYKELLRHKGRARLSIEMLSELIKMYCDVSDDFEIQAVYNDDNFDLITILAIDSRFDELPEGNYIPFYSLTSK